jgi:enamine deaminase RidA (YjgF/YER057c/UK114 family)
MNAVFSSYFDSSRRPGRTTVGVTDLARGGIVEIDLIAFRA